MCNVLRVEGALSAAFQGYKISGGRGSTLALLKQTAVNQGHLLFTCSLCMLSLSTI